MSPCRTSGSATYDPIIGILLLTLPLICNADKFQFHCQTASKLPNIKIVLFTPTHFFQCIYAFHLNLCVWIYSTEYRNHWLRVALNPILDLLGTEAVSFIWKAQALPLSHISSFIRISSASLPVRFVTLWIWWWRMLYLDWPKVQIFNMDTGVPCRQQHYSPILFFPQMFLIQFPFKNISSVLGTVTLFSQTISDSPCTDFYLFT